MSHTFRLVAIALCVVGLLVAGYFLVPRLLTPSDPTPSGQPSETYSVSGVVDYFANNILRVRYQEADPVTHIVQDKLVAVPVTPLIPISRVTVANDQVIRTSATAADLKLGTKVILYSPQDLRIAANPQLKRIDILVK